MPGHVLSAIASSTTARPQSSRMNMNNRAHETSRISDSTARDESRGSFLAWDSLTLYFPAYFTTAVPVFHPCSSRKG